MHRTARPFTSFVLALVACALLLATPALAGKFEKEIKRDWLGAWVVITSEVYSECGAGYTPNRINDGLTRGDAMVQFREGELAKIQRMDIKRSRLDLRLDLFEPMLIPYRSGPFDLYAERDCRVELEVMLDRADVKNQDMDAVVAALGRIVERHTSESSARDSASYNGREIDPLPDDYELTLAEHDAWQAETTNALVQNKLDEAMEVATELSHRVRSEPEYLAGFARGVERARNRSLDQCPVMLGLTLQQPYRRASNSKEPPVSQSWAKGHADGSSLVWSLELMKKLPGCFVAVPDVPGDDGVVLSKR